MSKQQPVLILQFPSQQVVSDSRGEKSVLINETVESNLTKVNEDRAARREKRAAIREEQLAASVKNKAISILQSNPTVFVPSSESNLISSSTSTVPISDLKRKLASKEQIHAMTALELVSYIIENGPSQPEHVVNSNSSSSQQSGQGVGIHEDSNFADWSTYTNGTVYWSPYDNTYVTIVHGRDSEINKLAETTREEGFRAVEGPKSFKVALTDEKWGDPSRAEWNNLSERTGALVEVNQEIARENIKNGADCLLLFPVYEEKVKEGKTVYKVRLVANGKNQKNVGSTYSATPIVKSC